ncbi:hypothetical protein KHQ84_gp173 [Rhodococcus phage Finch]|uniref:Uncharacterized protein n=1 Tax=Rhodococcus phage Finch TaxID=2094144 RepID=A0A2P1JXV9_9CAUD|nr:hypothetical protein KHQ84_gp173 [Rhodococcus phage Finch]AVO25158.1 hypothetical protein SEA_FINCH_173 [Rhodococcus phage Finch]
MGMDFTSARPWGAPEERAKVPPAPPPPPTPAPPEPKKREYWEEQEDNDRLVRNNTVLGYKRPLPHKLIKIVPEMTYFEFENNWYWSRGQLLPDFTRPKVESTPSDGDYLVITPKGKLMFISEYEVAEYFSLEG